MTQSTIDEMRQLLQQMNRLENRVLSLQDTISTFRSDVERQIGGARDGSTQHLVPHTPPSRAARAVSRESTDI